MKLLILKGLPASGKTTWAKEFVAKNKDWLRVSRDDLRRMRGEYWIPSQEDTITKWENWCVISALADGYNVILDATNLSNERNKARVREIKRLLPEHRVKELKVETKFFATSLQDCLKRNANRQDAVPAKVIQEMYDKYLAPPLVVYEEDHILTRAIIVDIDGTVAEKCDRDIYDYTKVVHDFPKKNIIEIVKRFEDTHLIIFLSGRDDSSYKETAKWLKDNVVSNYLLLMRKTGDVRKDSIVKKEIFQNCISGKFYIDFVLDDRDQVVEMWRKELGLTCLQVNYGNF